MRGWRYRLGVLALVLMVAGVTVPSAVAGAASRKAPVTIGFECSCTGAEASSIAIQAHVLSGWAAYENARGGIDGHRVKLITMDDALNPGTSLSQVTKMVTDDHVLAVIDGSDVDSAWSSYVEDHHVPVLAVNLSSSLAFTSPDFFPPGQTINTLAPSIAAAAKKGKVTNLATAYCSEDPICAELASPVAKAAEAKGIKSSFSEAISSSAPNYTAQCLAAKQAGANGIFVGQASQVVVAFAASCAQQGYSPRYLAEYTAISRAYLSARPLNGMVGIQNDLPAFVTRNRAIATMTAALKRYAPGTVTSPNYSPGITTVWAGAMLFAASLQHVSGVPTTAKVLDGLYKLRGATLGGITPPLTFHRGKPTTIACWYYMSIKNHAFTAPYGTKPACE